MNHYSAVSMTLVVWLTLPVVLVPVMVTDTGSTAGTVVPPPPPPPPPPLLLELPPPQAATPTAIRNTTQAAAVLQRRFLPRVTSKIITRANAPASDANAPLVQRPEPSGRTAGGAAAMALVIIVTVVVLLAPTCGVPKLQVAPAGRPVQLALLKLTVSLKPLTATTVSTVLPEPPAVLTVIAAGSADNTKSAPPLPTFHWLTRLATFSEPRPVARLYPAPAL